MGALASSAPRLRAKESPWRRSWTGRSCGNSRLKASAQANVSSDELLSTRITSNDAGDRVWVMSERTARSTSARRL